VVNGAFAKISSDQATEFAAAASAEQRVSSPRVALLRHVLAAVRAAGAAFVGPRWHSLVYLDSRSFLPIVHVGASV
jgi:hypothetical protein